MRRSGLRRKFRLSLPVSVSDGTKLRMNWSLKPVASLGVASKFEGSNKWE